ncbi:hypothetical protein NDU88_005681 [Pleurodeles waltl]|uniref:Uncharacterized protein n=1 Tax=Pleurodeles waltl TaxID=8319 RepID=A0AAV7SMC2_PLEWA|nr:hypothetical protein NDU88_005681 [Pleurodeles waltl]
MGPRPDETADRPPKAAPLPLPYPAGSRSALPRRAPSGAQPNTKSGRASSAAGRARLHAAGRHRPRSAQISGLSDGHLAGSIATPRWWAPLLPAPAAE